MRWLKELARRSVVCSVGLILSAAATHGEPIPESSGIVGLEVLVGLISASRVNDSVIHVKGSYLNRKSSRFSVADSVASRFEFWWSLKNPDHFRIEMKPSYTRWTNASYDYYEKNYSFASDGSKQVRVDFSAGGIGHATAVNRAVIEKLEWGNALEYLLLTGGSVFPPLLQPGEAARSSRLEKVIKSGFVSNYPTEGDKEWVITSRSSGGRNFEERLLFSNNFRKLKRRTVTFHSKHGNLVISFDFKVTAFVPLGEGFAYPQKIEFTLLTATGVERVVDITIDSAELISDKNTLVEALQPGVQLLDTTSWTQHLRRLLGGNDQQFREPF